MINSPELIGSYEVENPEMMFCMYLPIKFAGDSKRYLPGNLSPYKDIINSSFNDYTSLMYEKFRKDTVTLRDRISMFSKHMDETYVYITVKHLHVSPRYSGNRGGWHIDGFGTQDINYIWTDKFPTEFCLQDFNLSDDCEESLREMEEQARVGNIATFPEKSLLRLNSSVVHRVPEIKESGMRTFVKISFSKEKYNLVGNAHNYMKTYKWEMIERKENRNHTNG